MRHRRRPPRRAAALVEFAVVLPLLVTLVLGCVDFGRFASTHIAVTNAARAGAGYGCVNPWTSVTYGNWQAKVRQAAADEMASIPGFAQGQVNATGIAESGGLWRVQVEVRCPFQ